MRDWHQDMIDKIRVNIPNLDYSLAYAMHRQFPYHIIKDLSRLGGRIEGAITNAPLIEASAERLLIQAMSLRLDINLPSIDYYTLGININVIIAHAIKNEYHRDDIGFLIRFHHTVGLLDIISYVESPLLGWDDDDIGKVRAFITQSIFDNTSLAESQVAESTDRAEEATYLPALPQLETTGTQVSGVEPANKGILLQ
jgi:hypothetical protein